ncbi:MAG: fibronectin type III domain-containing protein [Bdellovibrio sp.]|nr:fibronectin type III domain-containing protein [Bdellovibrio sp.]
MVLRKSHNQSRKKTYTVFALSSLLLSSCGIKVADQPNEVVKQINLSAGVSSLAVNVNQYPSNKIVCDPFSGGGTATTSYEKGIKASLFYLTSGMPRMYNSNNYTQFAKKSDQNIFLADMNVPTRMFTEGFTTTSGNVLKNDANQKLIEYFGLKMTTNIVLSDTDEPGDYELAMLADDGTTLKIKSGTTEISDEILIDNEGDHPTRMGCAKRIVNMKRSVMLPIEATYYQGPRYHISNVLIWRKASFAAKDPLCNQLGNYLYFNPDQNSAPQKAFHDLEARGWKILSPDNFLISKTSTDYNPCIQGTDPVISNFAVGEIILTNVRLSWTTDIVATSHVELTNTKTGQVTLTQSDNVLRTTHDINLTGLEPATTYRVKAISVSSDLGRSTSAELSFTTQ